jgi:cobalamin biosynthesis protein CbiG
LSGHEGGANRLARRLASLTGGQAVITTASDLQDIPALDLLAQEQGWKIHPNSSLPAVMAALVDDEPVGIVQSGQRDWLGETDAPNWLHFPTLEAAQSAGVQALVYLTCHAPPAGLWSDFPKLVVYHPPALVVGVGCNRGAPAAEIEAAIAATLTEAGLATDSIACLATIQEKASEPGLIAAASAHGWPVEQVTGVQIRQIDNLPTPSAYAEKALGVPGVAEPAALLVAGGERLLLKKRKFANVTIAVALQEARP